MTPALSVARKEVLSYFSSPLAFIAVGAFLAASLFTFFWVEAFFARGIADVRPLFAWMPLLVMLLVAALGMRQWSEEQRSGTLEILLTLPVRPLALVLGKFLAIEVLVATALLLTLPLPLTVALLGDLDPGPVIGGYLASLLMAGAYAALALFLSSRTSNQIVAFISTAVVGGALYLVGTPGVTDFAGGAGDLLRQIGTGSRFASIERGVLDLRDLVYYLSLTAGFLGACVLALDAKRWSRGAVTARYRRRALGAAALAAANLILFNVWLGPFARLRVDLTAEGAYSLSPATVSLLEDLSEPLMIRAYLSERTHPLLAPLAPQIGGLLEEYRIAGRGSVTAEVVDPGTDPQAEEEAAQSYSIRPTPFQVEDRFEQGIVNSYFDVLVSYGDQYEVLGFQDLIRIDRGRDGGTEVRLRNFEYDLTRAIKKASSGFRSVDSLFAALRDPVELALHVTPDTLPAELDEPRALVSEAARALAERSGGTLVYREIDPGPDGSEGRQELADRYGLRPIAVSLFSTETYYFDLILEAGEQAFIVRPEDEYSAASVTAAVEAALKRVAPGFLRTIGVRLPPAGLTQDPFGRAQQPFASWQLLQQQLADDYAVQQVDLSQGEVPAQVDALLVVAPQAMSERERFAVDQYLMRGGALLVAAGSHRVDADPFTGGLTLRRAGEGIAALLESYGVSVAPTVVMDPQNEVFPTTVQSGSIVQIRAIDYPYFVDVRRDGMARTHPITSSLEAVTLNWASPLAVDGALAAGRQVEVLLHSTAGAWTTEEPTAQPDFGRYPDGGFARGDDRQEWPLAVAVTGRFPSAFAESGPPDAGAPEGGAASRRSVIDASPHDTRLVVFGSGEFLNDTIMSLSASLHGDRYVNSLLVLQNAVDWAVEDLDLLGIRSEGAVTRLLLPIDDAAERAWEVINYVVVALLLGAVGVVWWMRRRGERPMYGPAGPDGPARTADRDRGAAARARPDDAGGRPGGADRDPGADAVAGPRGGAGAIARRLGGRCGDAYRDRRRRGRAGRHGPRRGRLGAGRGRRLPSRRHPHRRSARPAGRGPARPSGGANGSGPARAARDAGRLRAPPADRRVPALRRHHRGLGRRPRARGRRRRGVARRRAGAVAGIGGPVVVGRSGLSACRVGSGRSLRAGERGRVVSLRAFRRVVDDTGPGRWRDRGPGTSERLRGPREHAAHASPARHRAARRVRTRRAGGGRAARTESGRER